MIHCKTPWRGNIDGGLSDYQRKLVEENMELVDITANKYCRIYWRRLGDPSLVREFFWDVALDLMIRCVKSYRPDRGTALKTYYYRFQQSTMWQVYTKHRKHIKLFRRASDVVIEQSDYEAEVEYLSRIDESKYEDEDLGTPNAMLLKLIDDMSERFSKKTIDGFMKHHGIAGCKRMSPLEIAKQEGISTQAVFGRNAAFRRALIKRIKELGMGIDDFFEKPLPSDLTA